MQHLNMLGRRRKYASSQSSYIGRFYGLLLMARYDGPGRPPVHMLTEIQFILIII
jgi:hypothetical protein